MALISDLQQPIQWPSLVACKVPLYKNEEKYEEFLMKVQNNTFKDEQEFNDLTNSSFYKQRYAYNIFDPQSITRIRIGTIFLANFYRNIII